MFLAITLGSDYVQCNKWAIFDILVTFSLTVVARECHFLNIPCISSLLYIKVLASFNITKK